MLSVTIFTEKSLNDEAVPVTHDNVNFVSLVNGGTHGPPALVAPTRKDGERQPATAGAGDRVLYINTSVALAWEIEVVS